MKQAFHFILNLTADRFRKRFKKFRDRFVILIFILCVQLFPVRCPKPGQTFFMNLQLALNHHHSQNGITRIVLPQRRIVVAGIAVFQKLDRLPFGVIRGENISAVCLYVNPLICHGAQRFVDF